MSGGGGGGGGGGGPEVYSPCESFKFSAQLTSPQPAVVAQLKVGDVLTIHVVPMNGQVVVQALWNGHLAGGLTGPDATRLRECAAQDHDFIATVLSITGGQVRVHVQHA